MKTICPDTALRRGNKPLIKDTARERWLNIHYRHSTDDAYRDHEVVPALWTSTSSRPSSSCTLATVRSTSASRVRSVTNIRGSTEPVAPSEATDMRVSAARPTRQTWGSTSGQDKQSPFQCLDSIPLREQSSPQARPKRRLPCGHMPLSPVVAQTLSCCRSDRSDKIPRQVCEVHATKIVAHGRAQCRPSRCSAPPGPPPRHRRCTVRKSMLKRVRPDVLGTVGMKLSGGEQDDAPGGTDHPDLRIKLDRLFRARLFPSVALDVLSRRLARLSGSTRRNRTHASRS